MPGENLFARPRRSVARGRLKTANQPRRRRFFVSSVHFFSSTKHYIKQIISAIYKNK
jgi:hypothetical protein